MLAEEVPRRAVEYLTQAIHRWQALDLPLWLHRSRVGLDSAMAVAAGHD